MKKNQDMPAYPDPARSAEQTSSNQVPLDNPTGLTKREIFAMAAMQGLASNSQYFNELGIIASNTLPVVLAEQAIELADELLKQLGE